MICRLYIGHSYLTLSFLLKGEEPQMCIACNERLTIEYILLTCSDIIEIRQSHFTAQSHRASSFRKIIGKKIYFLKEISIFDIMFNFEINFGSVCLLTTF